MATTDSIEQLVKSVDGLSFEAINDKYPNCHPEINPQDLYRAHLANVLSELTGVDHKIVYPNLQWSTGLDKGDMVLATPSLRLKGKKPDELAKEWAEKVCSNSTVFLALQVAIVLTVIFCSFQRMTPFSRSQQLPTTSWAFSSRLPPSPRP